MFGKKENKQLEADPQVSATIETIPSAFYGGSDPMIYHPAVEKEKDDVASNVPHVPVPAPVAPPLTPVTPPKSKSALETPLPKAPPSGKGKWIIGGILLLLIFASLGSWYYFSLPKVLPTPQTEEKPIVISPPPVETVVITSSVSTSPIGEIPSSTTSSISKGGGTLTLPRVYYATAPDNDADSLTNAEEEIFSIDPEVWDSDGDGYYDGLEVANLYNPKGIAPQKIIDSGLVREYINPFWQYRFYYPNVWRVDSLDTHGDDVLLSGSTGDYIEIRVFPKDSLLSFQDWFARTLPGESFSSLSSFENRFKIPAYKRQDSQVGFYETETAIYSIIYFYGEEQKNLFPHIMQIVLQSFRPSKIQTDIPDQPVLPGVVTSTVSRDENTSSTSSQLNSSSVSSSTDVSLPQ